MTITCFIRYEIDPFQREAFREYAAQLAHDHPALRRRPRRLLPAARGHQQHRLGADRASKASPPTRPIARGSRPTRRAARISRSPRRSGLSCARNAHSCEVTATRLAGAHDRRHLRSRSRTPAAARPTSTPPRACGRCSPRSTASSRSSASRASPSRGRSCRCRSGATRTRCEVAPARGAPARRRRRARRRSSRTTGCAWRR